MKTLLSIFTLLLSLNTACAQMVWPVSIVSAGELDGRLENFVDQVQVTVTNPTAAAQDVNYLITIERADVGLNINNNSFYQDFTFTAIPDMNTYTVRQVIDQFTGYNLDDFDFGSAPPGYEDYIRDQRRLPAGLYNTCLTVFDDMGMQLGSSCLEFEIAPRNPPEIQNPADMSSGAWITASDPVALTVGWIHPGVFGEKYTLEIKRFADYEAINAFDVNDHATFNALPLAIIPVNEIESYVYNVTEDEAVDLEAGAFIAIRVTAEAPVGVYLNEGMSNIVKAAYGTPASQSCDHPNFTSSVVWPLPGDTLPYRNIHYVVEFDPLCDNLKEFESTFMTVDQAGTTHRRTTVDNRWRINGGGPYHFLEHIAGLRGLPLDWVLPDSSYAQQLPLIHSETNSDIYNAVVPNETGYRMSANVQYTYYDRALGREETQLQALTEFMGNSFHIGMPTPKLLSPAHDATMEPGEISFSFTTGDRPTAPLPDFQILKIDGTQITNPYLNVQEKIILQVSTEQEFVEEHLIFDGLKAIQASSGHPSVTHDWDTPTFTSLPTDQPIEQTTDRLYLEEAFLDQVYREGEFTHTFTEEDTIYWRALWVQDPETINTATPHEDNIHLTDNQIYHPSAVRRLIITNTPEVDTTAAPSTDCASPCILPAISNTTALTTLANGQSFFAGLFEVTVTEVTGSNPYSGTGTIELPVLNSVNLMVNFSNIRINTDRKMYDGDVVAIKDPTPFRIRQQTGSTPTFIDTSDVNLFNDWMNEGERVFNFLTGRSVGLPIGIDREIDGRQVILGMVNATFSPRSSDVSFVAALEIPEIHSHLSLAASGICLQPNGFDIDTLSLYLPFDQGVDFQGTSVKMKGGTLVSDETEICYAQFTCNGFERAKIAMECKFPRTMLIPDNGGVPSTDENQRVSFFSSARYDLGAGLMLRFNMDPFYVKEADNLRFTLAEAYVDLSSAINPPSLTFPSNYVHASLGSDGRMGDTWEGFYMKELSMAFADDLIETGDTEIGVYDVIIDGDLTMKIAAVNIVEDGSIGDWKASLDTIALQITQSEVDEFKVKGTIEPPMAAEGEHLNYSLVMDFEADHNYYLQVDIEDSLNVPMAVAKMHLGGDSYVRAGRTSRRGAYIEATLSGNIKIDHDYASSTAQSSMPGMAMPYIRFEHLRMVSDTGVYCRNWDLAGLSSGSSGPPASTSSGGGLAPPLFVEEEDSQSFAGGFPISIEDISLGGGFSDPNMSATIKLNFQSGSNGIAADATLRFNGSYEDRGGGQKLRLEGVNLTGISIEAEFSSVTLNGSLSWIKETTKEEVRGMLEVGIPTGINVSIGAIFGTYKGDETAEHGSAEHFSYWLVDGAVSFGNSGVPIGSGLALYGIGGGVWHRMAMKEDGLRNARSTLSAPPQAPTADLDRYEHQHDQILGLRFAAVFGIQNSRTTLNLEVGILAEFNGSHGLSRLRIHGAVYVMQDIEMGVGGDDGGALYGQAVLEYRNTESAGKTFTGDIEIWLNVGGVIKGGIDDTGKLADVSFYADDSEWYFHMGSYDTSTGNINPGASIVLTVGGRELLEANAYMMVGHRVPLELPMPPENVRSILGLDTQSSGDNEISANDPAGVSSADYLTHMRTADGGYNTGQGFAFGTCVSANIGFEAFVYFNLGITLGFDVNLTKQTYECLEVGTPGFNGWYAQGQAYAAIEGELGIQFRFFGTRRIQLLYLGVAMMLEAKLANPSYFKGTAGVRYSVLGGAFTGQKSLKVEFGKKCEPLITDPLANIQFIDKIEPNQTMADVPVFSMPSVFYNFAMDRSLYLPRSIDADSGLPTSFYHFRPFVTEFKVNQHGETAQVAGTQNYTPDRKILQLRQADALAGNTQYDISCSVMVRDHTDGGSSIYQDTLGNDWVETKTEFFTTGDYPTVIPDENVKYTYPVQRQRFFLQDETNSKGTIALIVGMGSSSGSAGGLFYTEKDGQRYEYMLRMTKATDFSDTQDVPLTYSSGYYIPLNLPSLDNEEIYLAQVIRAPEAVAAAPSSSVGLGSSLPGLQISTSAIGDRQLLRQVFKTRLTESLLGFSDLTVTRLTPESLIGENEIKLFEFFFRTSKYNTLAEKLASADKLAKTPSSGSMQGANLVADLEISGDEGFDHFDLYGYFKNYVRMLAPMVSFSDPLVSDYWQKHGIKDIYTKMRQLPNFTTVPVTFRYAYANWNGTYSLPASWPNGAHPYPTPQGQTSINYYAVASENITMLPLEDGHLDGAISANYSSGSTSAPTSSSSSTSSSTSPFGGISIPGLSANSGLLGGFGPVINPALFGYSFYRPSSDKLLLRYDLAKQSMNQWNATKSHIYGFYYQRYGVRVRTALGVNTTVDLTKSIYQFISDENPGVYLDMQRILTMRFDQFQYVTTPYVRYSEFGNQNISNRYHIRFRFQPPSLDGSTRYLIPRTAFYYMESDPSRAASSSGPH